MRVLGVDPGLADTGWAVLESAGQGPRLAESGLIKTHPASALGNRLGEIHAGLREVIRRLKPDAAAVEEMFFLKAAHSVRASLQARGVVLMTAAQASVPISEYNPRQVKSSLTGSGAADKPQMQKMVQRLLGLERPLRPDDVADAAAIALCHLRSGRLRGLKVLERIGA